MQAQLDTTLSQMQELKLQKLELEQQLQRSAQARFVPVLTSEVQPAVLVFLHRIGHACMHLLQQVTHAAKCSHINVSPLDCTSL